MPRCRLQAGPELSATWTPLLASREYDVRLRPHGQKRGLLAGMALTEKQGGSDLRSNTTAAEPVDGGPIAGGRTYRLTGHKWFPANRLDGAHGHTFGTLPSELVAATAGKTIERSLLI